MGLSRRPKGGSGHGDDDEGGRKGGGRGTGPGGKPDAKGDGRRVQRVEREIREVIASYLIAGFRGELQGLVSVSRVQVTKDLRNGYVYISVLGSPGDADASLESLEENAYDVQNEISRKLKMKFCPRLKFFLDESMDNVIKVEKILRDISVANGTARAPGPAATGETLSDSGAGVDDESAQDDASEDDQ